MISWYIFWMIYRTNEWLIGEVNDLLRFWRLKGVVLPETELNKGLKWIRFKIYKVAELKMYMTCFRFEQLVDKLND